MFIYHIIYYNIIHKHHSTYLLSICLTARLSVYMYKEKKILVCCLLVLIVPVRLTNLGEYPNDPSQFRFIA